MRNISRRLFSTSVAAALLPATSLASNYPSRQIKLTIGFSAGGSTDAVARFYALKISEILKTPVIVENKPGAGQMVAIRSTINAPADGYNLYLGTASAISQLPGLKKDLPYDPIKSFTSIGLMASAIGVLVSTPALKVNSLEDFIKVAKTKKGELNYGSSGIGSASHLQTEYLKSLTGMEITHIPFKADAEIMQGIAAGQIHFGMSPVQGAMSSIKAGRCIPLAVTSSTRISELPNVPTLKELTALGTDSLGPYTYYALLAPAGLNPRIVDQLNNAINVVSKSKEATTQLRNQLYFDPETSTPIELQKYIEKDIEKWGKLASKINLS